MSVLNIITSLNWYSCSQRSVVERLMIREQENNDEFAVLLHGYALANFTSLRASSQLKRRRVSNYALAKFNNLHGSCSEFLIRDGDEHAWQLGGGPDPLTSRRLGGCLVEAGGPERCTCSGRCSRRMRRSGHASPPLWNKHRSLSTGKANPGTAT